MNRVTSEYRWIFVKGVSAAWGVSGSCRHLHAWERVAALGQAGKSSPLLAALRTSGGEVGVVLRMKTGVLARLIRQYVWIYLFISSQRAQFAGGLCLFFFSIVCAGWSLKWASLQDRLGCSGAPLPAFLSQDCSTLHGVL